jgi:hypothetical protein
MMRFRERIKYWFLNDKFYGFLYLQNFFNVDSVKTSFVFPADLYLELKKRAAEENRPVREIVIEALLEYFSKPRKSDRNRLIQLLTTPFEGASAGDYKEYEFDGI